MTPVKISIMLHYHCRVDDFHDGSQSGTPPAVRDGIVELCNDGMLRKNMSGIDGQTAYKITPKGRFYVAYLEAVPLPESDFVMPASPEMQRMNKG